MKAKQLWVGISATLFLLTPIGVNAQAAQQLIWEAPTSYVDGTPLTDLVSYTIHYGHTSRGAATNLTAFQYDFTATVAESQTTYPLASLPNFQGGQTYYFSVTAHDSSGNGSDFSNEVALDTTAPTVSLTAPADGALVLGTTVLVSAAASDDVGVVGVQFLLDGANLGSEDTSAPYTITWDTTTATTGGHTIAARARDAGGNQTTTATVHVTVQRMDADGDGLTDVDEVAYGTDPTVADTDGDGLTDGDEAAWWGADWNLNYDNDATANNLLDPDADNDGYVDGLERDYAFDPSDPTSKPLSLALPDADMDNVIGMSQDGLAAIVEIPAGALDADDTITVTVVDILDASGVLPGNVAGLIVDLILASGRRTVAEPLTVSFSYPDADQDGLVDGTNIDETTLTLFVFDTTLDTWVPIADAVVHPEVNRVEGTLDTLGEVGVFSVEQPLIIGNGDQSPASEALLTVSGTTHDLAVLQVRLETDSEPMRITSVSLDFADPLREGTAVDVGRLRVRLFDDANGNGHADTDEDVLVTEAVHGMVDTLTLEIPSWDLQAASTAHLLITLEMDAGLSTASLVALGLPGPLTRMGWLVLLPGGLGLVLCQRPRRRSLRCYRGLVFLLLCCILVLTSCDSGGGSDDGEETMINRETTFTVTLPAGGITGQDIVSGREFFGPVIPIVSPTIMAATLDG